MVIPSQPLFQVASCNIDDRSVVCSTVQSTGLIPATGSLLSWMIGWGKALHMNQALAYILGKCNYPTRKIQIQVSSLVLLSQGFANFLVNYLHFKFLKCSPRKFLFFFRLTSVIRAPEFVSSENSRSFLSLFAPPGLHIYFPQSLDHFLFFKMMMVSPPFLAHHSATKHVRIK